MDEIEVLKDEIKILKAGLDEIIDALDSYIDIVDGEDGKPQPNLAMRINDIAEETLLKCERQAANPLARKPKE